jgi:hypothetical protein
MGCASICDERHWRYETDLLTLLSIELSRCLDVNLLFQLNEHRTNIIRLGLCWNRALVDLPADVIPCFVGPEAAQWTDIEQETDEDQVELLQEMEEDGYQEFEDDDLDIGLVEHMDTLALADAGDL